MLAITVHFPLGGFEANRNDDLNSHEWPPCPDRLMSGLVSVAESAAEIEALRWLEGLDPPEIGASGPAEVHTEQRTNYVVTNEVDKKGRSWGSLAARSGGASRTWLRVTPAESDVTYVWDQASGSDEHRSALDELCRRLPYLGRSTSPVVAAVTDVAPAAQRWTPSSDGDVRLTVPSTGYYDALERAFQADEPPWSVVRRSCVYAAPGKSGRATDEPRPFANREWVVFGIEGRRQPAYQHLVALTTAFRSAALAMAGDEAPYALHGHGEPGGATERVMFLGLPYVGAPHADGHLLGFAVSIPKDLADGDRLAVYRSLVGISEIKHAALGNVRISRSDVGRTATLDPERWTRPSTRWTTAYPAVLDRHIRKPTEIAPTVARMCERVGLPEPLVIDWSPSPFLAGPDRLSKRHTVRRPDEQAHKFFHLRLTFPTLQAGPIVLGHMRHFGLGLMLPDRAGETS